MDKTNIKQQLKLAKEKFLKKDFSDVVKLCKTILTADPKHISCRILYGASLLEIPSKKDEAIQQFQKVIDLSPNNVFAWQGAEQYYEKCDKLTVCQQLFYTYANLLSLETDGAKCKTRANKCLELWRNYKTKLDLGVFVSTVLPKIENEEITPQFMAICKVLVEFPFTEDTAPLDEYLEKMYVALCRDENYDQRFEIYCKLIPVLKSKGKRRLLVDTLEEMLSVYRDNAVAINFFCESFISNYIKTVTDSEDDALQELVEEMSTVISERCDVLLLAQPTNPNSLIAKSIALRRRNEFEDSRKLLRRVLQVAGRSWQSWFLLTEIQINVRCYDDVIRCVQQAKKIVKSTFSCYRTMSLWEIEARCWSRRYCGAQARQCAIAMYDEDPSDKLMECIIVASCRLNDEATANRYLNALPNRREYLEALCHSEFGRLDDALRCSRRIVDDKASADTDATLLLADVLWKRQLYSEAGKLYLDASRISPHRCDLIMRLGHYYRETKRLSVAVTCYEKSVVLNADDEENAVALSDAYIELSKSEEQETLLNYLKSSSNVNWAVLRLGVHYLNSKRYEDAVDNLQIAVKYDPDNVFCQECLGDALVGWGSLLGAKLTYMKCAEMDPTRLYPKLQTAKIEYRLGLVDSSIRLFRDIADRYRDDPVAQLDAARMFVEHARSIIDRQVRTSFDLCADACQCLHRALFVQQTDVDRYAFTWKLLGDVCLFIAASMPERLCSMCLPSNVFDTDQTADGYYEVSGLQLYTYSRRCYARALSVTSKNVSLNSAQKYMWHDIAKCYAANALDARVRRDNVELRTEYKRKAEQAMQKCLSLDPGNGCFWNAMGLIEAIEETVTATAASYRCFVKSLEIEINAVAYNNLAVTCLTHGNAELADEAFTLSQHLDPTLANGWVGKAILARLTEDRRKSADLFYHSTTLPGLLEESVCGYTEDDTCYGGDAYVEEALTVHPLPPTHRVQHNIDLLTWLTEKNPENSWAQNALSVLCTRVGLYRTAIGAAKKAVQHCTAVTGRMVTGMRRNLAFSLLRAGRYMEAADEYARMHGDVASNVCDRFGEALALYKTGRETEARVAYEILSGDESVDVASTAYAAMAAMAFAGGDSAAATTLLLKSIRSNTSNVQALLAAFALGVITRNGGLSKMILHELVQHRDHPVYSKHVVRFEAYFHYLNRQPVASLRLISRRLHSHPGDGDLWINLGFILLNYYMADGSKRRTGLGSHLFTCATTVAGDQKKDDSGDLENRALVLTAVCNLFESELNVCMRNTLKGLHSYPTSTALWTVLLNAIYCRGRVSDAPFLREHISFVCNRLNPDEFLKRNLSILEKHVP